MGGYMASRCCYAKCLTAKKRTIKASRPATDPTTAAMMVFVWSVEEGWGDGGEVAESWAGA